MIKLVDAFVFELFWICLRHTIFAASVYNIYGGSTFTAITDAIFVYKTTLPTSEELKSDIEKQIAVTAYSIYSAASILRDPLDFQRYFV